MFNATEQFQCKVSLRPKCVAIVAQHWWNQRQSLHDIELCATPHASIASKLVLWRQHRTRYTWFGLWHQLECIISNRRNLLRVLQTRRHRPTSNSLIATQSTRSVRQQQEYCPHQDTASGRVLATRTQQVKLRTREWFQRNADSATLF